MSQSCNVCTVEHPSCTQQAYQHQHLCLQELGNDIVAASNDVYDFNRGSNWGVNMDKQPVWQFIYNNAPGMGHS